MPSKNILYFLSICLISIFCHEAESAQSCPFFGNSSTIRDTGTVNIYRSDYVFADVSTPLTMQNGLFGPLLVKNTGYALEAFAVTNGGTAYGGVLCGEKFTFYKIRFYIAEAIGHVSYNLIEGVGSTVTVSFYYFNPKYGSFEEALKHPDGVVAIHYMITYGETVNYFFKPADAIIRSFRSPGTSRYIAPEILLFAWFNIIPLTNRYYAYIGSYVDLETGKEYPNVFEIQTDGIFPLLTKDQLGAFLSLLNTNGTQLKTVGRFNSNLRKPYFGVGFGQTTTLF